MVKGNRFFARHLVLMPRLWWVSDKARELYRDGFRLQWQICPSHWTTRALRFFREKNCFDHDDTAYNKRRWIVSIHAREKKVHTHLQKSHSWVDDLLSKLKTAADKEFPVCLTVWPSTTHAHYAQARKIVEVFVLESKALVSYQKTKICVPLAEYRRFAFITLSISGVTF